VRPRRHDRALLPGPSTSPLEDMTERWSRFAVAIEALLLAFPVTYLAIAAFAAGMLFLTEQTPPMYERAQTIVYALPIIPLAAGWILIGRFVIAGSPALRSSSNVLWLLSFLGVIIALAALFVGHWSRRGDFGDAASLWPWVRSYFRELALGIPAMIPLIHLTLERRFRMSSNNRWRGP